MTNVLGETRRVGGGVPGGSGAGTRRGEACEHRDPCGKHGRSPERGQLVGQRQTRRDADLREHVTAGAGVWPLSRWPCIPRELDFHPTNLPFKAPDLAGFRVLPPAGTAVTRHVCREGRVCLTPRGPESGRSFC